MKNKTVEISMKKLEFLFRKLEKLEEFAESYASEKQIEFLIAEIDSISAEIMKIEVQEFYEELYK